jgi:asparagine synthase (glutamine-hydrolysing)
MVWNIYHTVSENGVRVLLDGHDGDSVVSHGYKYLDELAIAGRWWTFMREAKGLARHYGDSAWTLSCVYGKQYALNPIIARHASLKTARRVWRRLSRFTSFRVNREDNTTDWQKLMHPEFVARTNMPERYKASRKTLFYSARSEREAHYRTLSQPLQGFALEVHDSAAAAFSIEKRYPFWDRRLVEFCLSLPPEQKLCKGWTRMVMRRAMENILPEKVQWRGGKIDFTPSLRYGLVSFEREVLDRIILRESSILENYVNVTTLREAYGRILEGESSSSSTDLFNVWKCASLALWLQHAGSQ